MLQCLWSSIFSHLLMRMLVHNVLDLVSVLRVKHMQNQSTTWRYSYCRLSLSILDVESRCKIKCKLEGPIRISLDALVDPNLESKKRMHVIIYVTPTNSRCIAEQTEIQDLTLLMTLTIHCLHLLVLELVVRALTMWHLTWSPHGWVLRLWLDTS